MILNLPKVDGKAEFDWIRAEAFRLRGGIWTVLFLAILAVARPTATTILVGALPVLLGQALRCWAVGCIVLYRGERVKARRLVTWGPYSICRNPLYVALSLFFVVFVALYGFLIVPWEERFLSEKFGKTFDDYRKRVGTFWPKIWPPSISSGPFDYSVIWNSEKHSMLVTVVGTSLLLSRLWW
jgi:protein-S-isoprenylcysteine O-methyltransferase Ste14